MIEFGKGYKPNNDYDFELKAGEHLAMITHVKLGVSKKGNPTAYITLMINKKVKMFFYLPDDRSTMEACIESNARLTRFFDCFGIARGNFNINTWIGKNGWVVVDLGKPKEDGKCYFEVKKLVVKKKQNTQEKTQVQYTESQKNNIQKSNSQHNVPQKIEDVYAEEGNQEEYYPTNEDIMQEAREEGYDVSEEYFYDENKITGEAYEEAEIY